jgi:hypothetical protein
MARDEPITYEELSAEHKQRYDEIKAQFEADLIGSFERTHHHGVRWKGFSLEGALDGVDLSTPSEDRTRALRQEVNYTVAHSLHRHSESLVNAFEHVALRVVQEIMKHQHSPTGPTLGSHKGEFSFQTRPPLPYVHCLMCSQLRNRMVLRLTWFIRWEVTPWITSSSASHPGKSRMAICVLIYWIAVIRYIQHRRQLEEFLERMQTNKHG